MRHRLKPTCQNINNNLTGSSEFTLKSLLPVNWQQPFHRKVSAASGSRDFNVKLLLPVNWQQTYKSYRLVVHIFNELARCIEYKLTMKKIKLREIKVQVGKSRSWQMYELTSTPSSMIKPMFKLIQDFMHVLVNCMKIIDRIIIKQPKKKEDTVNPIQTLLLIHVVAA